MIQNRFHYVITGQMAVEIVCHNADHNKEHMGLTTWKNSPNGRILKSDVTIAKNYLQEKEIKELELAVSVFFDYIENLIRHRNHLWIIRFCQIRGEYLQYKQNQRLSRSMIFSIVLN